MRFALSPLLALSAVALVGCAGGDSESFLQSESALCSEGTLGAAINSTGKVPAGCVRIEGAQIGRAPQTLIAGGVTVTITGWTAKQGSAGEWVGFRFTQTGGSVAYAVKASTRTFASKGTSWQHPDGQSGPAANGISNITFCVDTGGGSTPGGGTGTGADGGSGGGTTPGGGTGTGADGGNFNEGIPGSGGSGADGGNFNEGIPGSGGSGADGGNFNEGIPGGGTPGSGEECTPNGGSSGGAGMDGGTPPGGSGSPCTTHANCAQGLACEQNVCAQVIG